MGPYGQFFPASSPGPPIQTTASNKGPDGANLFIFHIPNHFTNLDMYQLFCPYGNLLSVRIMVEKDTGRSRGFGFVSYDSPESAALAIKELNGFAVRSRCTIELICTGIRYRNLFLPSFVFSSFKIGNKRLKVQHKQIRDQDLNQGYDGYGGGHGLVMTLPPANPGEAAWYGQAPDSMGATEGSGAENADFPYDDSTGPAESGIDPLSGFDPLRQALPEAGVTEST
jgi:RNA recognition motif-containing protein